MINPDKQTLDFLHACALDKNRSFAEAEQTMLHTVHGLLKQAEEIIICLGGKAGRLGECIVGSALLEGTLQALHSIDKAGLPVHIFVDEGVADLFEVSLYQNNYWSAIRIIASKEAFYLQKCVTQVSSDKNVVVLDFHGSNDGMPYLQFKEYSARPEAQGGQGQHTHHIAILGQCFRVGVRSYADRGPERRYADFIEILFGLAEGTIDGRQAQPRLLLSDEGNVRYYQLVRTFGLDPDVPSIVGFFQSVVPAKCYERWDEVLQLLCEQLAVHMPGRRIDIVLACGPDTDLPQGIRKADIEEWLGDFHGVEANARVLIRSTVALRDLALLTSHAVLVLANDTGPGHISGALGVPTVTPFLPGNIYSKKVWSSTLYHHGVTIDPNPYSFAELEAAVLWGKTDIINRVEPQEICEAAWQHLK